MDKTYKSGDLRHGETHDVEIVADDPFDEHGAFALDAVGTGFIHRFPGGDIIINGFVGERVKFHFRFLEERADRSFFDHGDAGIDKVFLAGERFEHPMGVRRVFRFPENGSVEHDDGVGTNDKVIGMAFSNSEGFLFG